MVAARIPRSPAGNYPRFYLELPVADTQPLEQLQDQLTDALPGFEPASPEGLHMTVLHVGKPQELLSEMRAWQRGQGLDLVIDLPAWLTGLEQLAERWHLDEPDMPLTVTPKALALFGMGAQPVVALRLAQPRRLKMVRKQLWSELLGLLGNCGLVQPDRFALHSPLLSKGLPSAYRPHITLGRLASSDMPVACVLPRRVEMGTLRFRGVDFLSPPRNLQ